MEFQFNEKVAQFLTNKNITHLLLTYEFREEPCTQIYNPIVKSISSAESANYERIGEKQNIFLYLQSEFLEQFEKPDTISLVLKGMLKKKLEITNIDPKITNICKI